MAIRVPLLQWVRLDNPQFGEGLIAFTYIDHNTGLSCKGFSADVDEPTASAESPPITVRLTPPREDLSLMSAEEVTQLGLPELPSWIRFYGQQPSNWGYWFDDPVISKLLHPDYPCDLPVLFLGLPGEDEVPSEKMWVRLFDREDDSGFYLGILLNQPDKLKRVQQNDEVRLRVAPGSGVPLYVGYREALNSERYRIACEKCGFDMLTINVPSFVAKNFPGIPPEEKVEKFTTRCPLCRETMLVENRDAI